MNPALHGKELIDWFLLWLSSTLADCIRYLFGNSADLALLGPITLSDLAMSVLLLASACLVFRRLSCQLSGRLARTAAAASGGAPAESALHTVHPPARLLAWTLAAYLSTLPLLVRLGGPDSPHPVRLLLDKLAGFGVFAALIWLAVRLTARLEHRLSPRLGEAPQGLDSLIFPLLARSLRLLIPVISIILTLPLLGLPADYGGILKKCGSILIIGTISWILCQTVSLAEKAVLARYNLKASDNLKARKIFTQVHVLSKTLYVVISLFSAASILMLFDEVRQFGASLLASAGVIGVVVGFAAQRTIANLFAGFQLAMTQPIRLDDVVVVEGEWGKVEEITLTYVVIMIWDERRLVLPLSYFIEKPFQNWTRTSANILGSIFLWTDYSLPIEAFRGEACRVISASPNWDGRFWNVQVTDASASAMQIRVLATSADSSKSWDLRCEIREKLVAFIQQHHPESLPKIRGAIQPGSPRRQSEPAACPSVPFPS
jgi:small-conductance mechanosensitive channel